MHNMIIIGSGSRDWRDYKPIRKVMMSIIKEFAPDTFIYYHGDQRGFDQISAFQLKRLGQTKIQAFPYIKELGKAGGMARNKQMLDSALTKEQPHDILLIAMPLPQSIGTYGMINISKQAGIHVRIYDPLGVLIDPHI